MVMNRTQTFVVPDNVISRQIDDEVILVNLATDRIFSLNSTGARLWEIVSTGSTAGEVRSEMLAVYDVEPEQLDREIDALLRQLMDEGFLVESSS